MGAVCTAIEFEAIGEAFFYAEVRNGVNNPEEKAFFDLLAAIEHEHCVSLKDTEEYLLDPAAWFTKAVRGRCRKGGMPPEAFRGQTNSPSLLLPITRQSSLTVSPVPRKQRKPSSVPAVIS